ncbi:MAG: hypothetical protein A2Y86_02320 [Candidatus Aminicenantes bacterium RBG_13_62_12]|nr:MAG: hypothetical protein A2Y86_02320 [Candidatus Aminicenantes bacterium RBG_13_62_12]
MKTRLYCPVLLGLAMLVAFPNAPGAQVPSTTSADREALAAVVQKLDAAWNARDVDLIPVQPVIRKTAELLKFNPCSATTSWTCRKEFVCGRV